MVTLYFFLNDTPNFIFNKNGTYIYKNGIFNYDDHKNWRENKTIYLGERTKYEVKKDSVFIFNLISKKWEGVKINKSSKDSLILTYKDKSTIYFIHSKKKNLINNPLIDKIVVSKGPCYGSCPINSTILDINGNILFFGEAYNSKSGFLKGRLNETEVKEIFSLINEMDIKSLQKEYNVSVTDLSSSYITFISGGKMYKTIYDYGGQSPFELKRLIRNVSYLYQNHRLQSVNIKDPLLIYDFQSRKQQVSIKNETERFYLFSEILNAKPINNTSITYPFTGKYRLELPENIDYKDVYLYERKVETDGRFFKVQQKDNSYITLDLGYNFFEKNNLIKK